MNYIYTSIISYLLGSFNIAYFIAKANGFDIRERGSRNAGASNMKVNFGWWAGILTALVDMLKAIIAVRLCSYLFPDDEIIPFLAGAMTIVGHIFPFYMGFRGGKGFASYLGMVIAINWKLALAVMALTAIVTYVTNYIVIGTFSVITVVPLYYIFNKASIGIIAILVAVALLMLYKHRINIKRIISHEEIGLREKKKKA
ncbi:MAG: glycerol-3-phosphate acyltransferase [Erysipelotrichaceae bacterium]|nr:glycerol-3-phosphate acyltransferase [Erysipelotrichaceae bacterium]MBR5755350.1 glycerol-3-phosphate acyltransferase [Erysipelotrichaceae bacterium]